MLDNNNKLWFSILLCQAIIKVWSTFSKVVGVWANPQILFTNAVVFKPANSEAVCVR